MTGSARSHNTTSMFMSVGAVAALALVALPMMSNKAAADGCMTYGQATAMTAMSDGADINGVFQSDELTSIILATDVPMDLPDGIGGQQWIEANLSIDGATGAQVPVWNVAGYTFDNSTGAAGLPADIIFASAALTEIDPASWTANGLMGASSS